MAYTYKHGDRPIDGYTIQRAVGKGGFGEVYYAVSDGGREVAIKYLRDNPQIELRGVSNCINLKSPHLVAIFDVKKTVDGEYGIIMEYCSGPSLRDLLIAEPNGFEPQKAAFFLREIAKGLAYLHDRGIVHRDLKPGNIFYDDGYVKIGDYGLSKFISVSRHSGQTASVGTVHYMAPEIGSGNYSKGVDIYALGVMLYEMLLGKVPFEGSSMAEVLMKHLTTQPEVDHLPQPFGDVIRKALQKDPNDRYPSVDEMVETLLDVDTVRQSLAGFSPKSLDGAVRQGAAARADSPMPSPNPAPQPGQPFAQPAANTAGQPPYAQPVGRAPVHSKRMAKRMDRISRKMETKMAKLGGRRERKVAPPPPPPAQPGSPPAAAGATPMAHPGNRKKRMLLSGVLSLGLAIGLGVLVGNAIGNEEAGVSAGLLVILMSSGMAISRRAIRWFDVDVGPGWAQFLIKLVCLTPLTALGAAPLMDRHDEGIAIWLGLLAIGVLGSWDRSEDDDEPGEVRFGAALWKAICALIFTAIIGSALDQHHVEDFVLISAGVAGAVSLIIQATAWWSTRPVAWATQPVAPVPQNVGSPAPGAGLAPDANAAQAAETIYNPVGRYTGSDTPAGMYTDESGVHLGSQPTERWGITRAFWGIVAFMLMGGAIFTCLMAAMGRFTCSGDLTGVIIGSVACFSFMTFALRKVSPIKREGFWRETLRPFLQSASMFGVGATVTGIATTRGLHGEELAGLITGLVLCSIIFFVLLFLSGRKRQPQPFLRSSGSGHMIAATGDDASAPACDEDGSPC